MTGWFEGNTVASNANISNIVAYYMLLVNVTLSSTNWNQLVKQVYEISVYAI